MSLYPQSSPHQQLIIWISLWISISSLTACDLIRPPRAPLAPHSPQVLQKELIHILDLARTPQTDQKLKAKLSSYFPTASQVQALFRDNTLTQGLGSFYESQIRPKAIQELPWTMKELAHLGYMQVDIARVGPQAGSTNAYGDLALLEQLKVRLGLHTVRIRKEDQNDQSLRLSGWLYLENHGWISLLKLGEEIRRRQGL